MGNKSGRSHFHNHYCLPEMPRKVRELHCAVMSNERETVRHLISEGIDVNFPWNNPTNPSIKDGSTPLICAVSLNHVEIVEILLANGAFVNKADRNGCTPLYKAAFHGRPVLIELLANAGANVNVADNSGKTPLYICVNNAIVHSCKQAVQKLVGAGAIVDKQDKTGQAPVHIAAHWKLMGILQLLISAKGDVNLVDTKGRTPLYVCVSSLSTKLYAEDVRHQMPCIQTLYRAGADMLNLTEWLLFKGPGIPKDLLAVSVDFATWYTMQISRPQTLTNICRKVIQKTLSSRGDFVKLSHELPLPPKLQEFVSRKMFYHENT